MPRFSVIVPVYKVRAYLHSCLSSVLDQSYADLELIAVDDCSPDGGGEIVEEFAARDPRVRALRLAENAGPGRARDAGLKRARGTYVLFLDGDDTLAPGALRAIADRLADTGSPDVLVYDHVRTFWDGREISEQPPRLLTEEGPQPFQLADRDALLELPAHVWNKAYNRDFIEREGFSFPPGHPGDIPWTYPVLMASSTIATLDRVCVHHRHRRHRPGPHTDLDPYDRVFEFLDQHPDLDDVWRPTILRRAAEARTERRRRTNRTHRALRAAKRATARLSRYATGSRRALRAALLRLHYRVQLRLPVRRNEAVFARSPGRGHGGDPGALEAAFRTYAPRVRTSWIARPEHRHTVPEQTRTLAPGTAAYWTALARSKYLVTEADFGHRLVKRPGQILIRTQHGTPLKKTGLDLQDHPAASHGTDFAALLRSADTWDHVLSANRHSTLVWEYAFPAAYETLEYGSPANDRLHKVSSEDVARARDCLGVPRDALAILYAPTHRDYRSRQRVTLDLDRVLRLLGPGFVVLTRAPFTYDEPPAPETAARLIDVSEHPDVGTLCLAADALVTDYSSLMFDYACLDRPIVIHADDWEAYEAARGTYFDLRSFPPGAVARSADELIDIFATGHWRGSRSAQLRSAFRARFCPYDDGRAAERVVRRVVLGEQPHTLPQPPRSTTELTCPTSFPAPPHSTTSKAGSTTSTRCSSTGS
ncbi:MULTISPECIES: bifunctional glycosyltransferase/CDP-glycerol:glycerophosphate glycerophosphotransferase [unclassified Streptomyces]|uniref:bifunctional glycosyltransferase/CDP-glycerol:glycerophosphate glycerophosphotransferase n=1 Tax=unclassified Streptomyces TaxID=2593676 RepID=UPI00278BEDAF|nr:MULTISPECIES: bifunctional glycosyltransferase/CDP-glycerol:glycerophosphate glycerophosphotransferase [unclassified Streptomyces]